MCELLDHNVMIGLCTGATLVFVAIKWGGVQAVVACWAKPVMIRQLVRGLHVQDGVWGLGLTPAQWCIPTVGHDDIIIVVWCGNRGGLVHHPVALVGVSFEFGVGGCGWELVSVVSHPVLLLNLLLYFPLSADALVVDLLGLLWGQP